MKSRPYARNPQKGNPLYSEGAWGGFVLEPRTFWIGIEIEIAIEIGKLPEIDFDHDFDFDDYWPTLGGAP
ncbi:hypothetical protein [Desulfonatronum lacustre]|uniref:hypothetical protein n=1 Tax=Desulfonatronum lacustre TaxID=66849 RepID=UPI00048F87F7|nr:hypothetical protein [Desulfonatronum lacustre]